MRLCFIVEARYRNDGMPLDVVEELVGAGHEVDILEPQRSLAAVSELGSHGRRYDAYVLKTVSDGPGLSILAAASAVGHLTINNVSGIRLARDKAVAAALCRQHRIPFPLTYFASRLDLLSQVPPEVYPIVIKPANGSSCESVYRVDTVEELATLDLGPSADRFLLAQPYAENPGYDLKLYCTGEDIYATIQQSPLHPEVSETPRLIPTPSELEELVVKVGRIFGLTVFGIDVLESPDGWVVVDVNDFPSFHFVPRAPAIVGEAIVRLAAAQSKTRRSTPALRASLAPSRAGA
jgi:ribosomal protein S6--L-glutamate ligase